MSRIGKKAVAVPSGVMATVQGQTVNVKGPKGARQLTLPDDVIIKMDKASIKIEPREETLRSRAMWGTSRTRVANLMIGVTKGFEEKLEITGVGYRAAVQGKQKVGQVAAEIRGFRRPEPYKGKGVKYVGEYIFRKEGKKK